LDLVPFFTESMESVGLMCVFIPEGNYCVPVCVRARACLWGGIYTRVVHVLLKRRRILSKKLYEIAH
jgi:hypothetical protein